MANQARVTSTEALEFFRAKIIVFRTKARRALDDVSDEVGRTRQWLQHDQRLHWEGELRRRTKVLDRAKQELLSVRMAAYQRSAMLARQAAVVRAQREFDDAEEKIHKIKTWCRDFDNRSEPIVKKLESLREMVDQSMPKAISYLLGAQRSLDAYVETAVPTAETESAPETPVEAEKKP